MNLYHIKFANNNKYNEYPPRWAHEYIYII